MVATLVESQRSQRRLTIAKFGGGVIGEHGQGIAVIVDRIAQIDQTVLTWHGQNLVDK